jgi:hypothetical protein
VYDTVGPDFLLDGYDWTAIDVDDSSTYEIPPGEEQAARWYGAQNSASASNEADDEMKFLAGVESSEMSACRPHQHTHLRVISHHFPLQPVADPTGDGDMNIPRYAGSDSVPKVRTRFIVHDLSVKLRFFDGYDWPEMLDSDTRTHCNKGTFVISDAVAEMPDEVKAELLEGVTEKIGAKDAEELQLKAKLMGGLLAGAPKSQTFRDIPLPEEKGKSMKALSELRKLSRRPSKYFQMAASGVSTRVDSLEESDDHRLVSVLNMKAQDVFFAETISSGKPVKLAGEWFNEADHPRDTKDGLFMMKVSSRNLPNTDILFL